MSALKIFGLTLYRNPPFEWYEPGEARRNIFVQDHNIIREEVIPSAIIAAVIIGIWEILELADASSKIDFLSVIYAVVGGFVIVAPILRRITSFLPRPVAIKEEYLWIGRGRGSRGWKFSKFSEFQIQDLPNYWILELATDDKRAIRVGVPLSISADAVATFLVSRGLKQKA